MNLRPILTILAIILAFVVNTLSNVTPIGGKTVGELANTLFANVLITPANYAFAIWGLIYLSLLAFGVYQLLPAQRHNPQLDRIGYLLVMASVAQTIWIILFQLRLFTLSVLAMFLILLPLGLGYWHLRIGKAAVGRSQYWSVQFPMSVYFAWISVATIVNVATALYAINGDRWGLPPALWTIVMLVIATGLAIAVSVRHHDGAFVGVYLWALVAIAIRNLDRIEIAGVAGLLGGVLVLVHLFATRSAKAIKPPLRS